MDNTINDSAIKKLKLLFTVVDRNKGEFFVDVLSQYEVNCQMVVQVLLPVRVLFLLSIRSLKEYFPSALLTQ